MNKDHNYKACFRLKVDGEKNYVTKRVISKILKLDENNHYDYAMTKPLPTGCIKKQTLKNNYIEKQKIIDVAERSVYQLIEQYSKTSDGNLKSYHTTKKAYATLFEKRFQPLYLEHLSFLINRAE